MTEPEASVSVQVSSATTMPLTASATRLALPAATTLVPTGVTLEALIVTAPLARFAMTSIEPSVLTVRLAASGSAEALIALASACAVAASVVALGTLTDTVPLGTVTVRFQNSPARAAPPSCALAVFASAAALSAPAGAVRKLALNAVPARLPITSCAPSASAVKSVGPCSLIARASAAAISASVSPAVTTCERVAVMPAVSATEITSPATGVPPSVLAAVVGPALAAAMAPLVLAATGVTE